MVPQLTVVRGPTSWYGGKGHTAHHIVPLLPHHTTYVEPYAGGLWVLFSKPPSKIEIVNDLHDGLVNLYTVLRDEAATAQLQRLCELTPYSRAQWQWCVQNWSAQTDRIQKAWAFLVASRQSHNGGVNSPSWSYSVASGVTTTTRWLSTIDGLMEVHQRLRRVQVEHLPALKLLRTYDGPDTCFYCDPPYIPATRSAHCRYEYEMSTEDHRALHATLQELQGKVLLSGYRHHLHKTLEDAGWSRHDYQVPVHASTKQLHLRRLESLWLNPAAQTAAPHQRQLPWTDLGDRRADLGPPPPNSPTTKRGAPHAAKGG